MKKAILVVLQGGGDTEIKLCNAEAMEWINSPYPDSGEEIIPADVLFGFEDSIDDEALLVRVTSGSGDNDRALACPGHHMPDIMSAMKFAKANNIEIVNEYHGCIY